MNLRAASRAITIAALAYAMLPTPPAAGDDDALGGMLVFDRGDSAIFVSRPDGSGEFELAPSYVEGCCARWSPDGTLLAHPALDTSTGQGGTAIVNADGSGLRMLPPPERDVVAACGPWAPDGQRLACQAFDLADADSPSGVFTVRASDGGDLKRLTTNPYRGGGDDARDYSPDGHQIVFFRDQKDLGGVSALFVVNTDGTGEQRITPWRKVRNGGSWSPDGTWILFNDYRGRLWKVHPDGTGMTPVRLDVAGRYFAFEPTWSPDGRHIAFSMWNPARGQDDIYIARSDGSDVVTVTDTPEHEGNVDWGPAHLP